jgi:hypothetical protein
MLKVTRKSVTSYADLQRIDYKQLSKAAEKLKARRAALLNPEVYSEEAIAKHRQELAAEYETTIAPLFERIRERVADVRGAAEAWTPAQRRLEAAIADPAAAAALAVRLASVPVGDLPRLAQEAVDTANWLLADAVAAQRARIDSADDQPLAKAIETTLAAMGADELAPALTAAAQVGEFFALAQIDSAEASGFPMRTTRLIGLAMEYPGAMTTGKAA